MINYFDYIIICYINSFAQHSWAADTFIIRFGTTTLLKSVPIASLLWWAWFTGDKGSDPLRTRKVVICTVAGVFVALLITKTLTLALPFRPRPFNNTNLALRAPLGMNPHSLDGWSSFPSDHATLFLGLAAGLFYVSRGPGWFGLTCAIVTTVFPRMYLGLHYPTDILVGGMIGILLVGVANLSVFRESLSRPFIAWSQIHPASFYACAFILTFNIADVFSDVRTIGEFLFAIVKGIV